MNRRFREIFSKYYPVSKMFAKRIVEDTNVAEDIAQEVFCILYEDTRILNWTDGQIYNWVKKVTLSKVYDYLKSSSYKQEILVNDTDQSDVLNKKYEDSVELQILRNEKNMFQKNILKQLKEKSDKNYEILMQVKCMGKDPKLVAEEFGLTRGNVDTRISRIRQYLRKELENY